LGSQFRDPGNIFNPGIERHHRGIEKHRNYKITGLGKPVLQSILVTDMERRDKHGAAKRKPHTLRYVISVFLTLEVGCGRFVSDLQVNFS